MQPNTSLTGGVRSLEAPHLSRTKPKRNKKGKETVFDRLQTNKKSERSADVWQPPRPMEREGGLPSEREEGNTYTGLGFTKQELDKRVHDRELVMEWRDECEPFNTKIAKGEAAWDSLPAGPWHRQPQTIEVTCPSDARGGEQIALDGVSTQAIPTIP